jgi:hypothetical protein
MGLSFSKFTQLLGSTYKNTKPVADAAILGYMGAPSSGRVPVISTSGQTAQNTGLFASANTFFKSDLGKAVGTAVLSRALQPKPQPAVLRYAEQTETNDANLKVMRQKAEEAGFNPLTVLRAGGINAYATRKTNIPSYAPQLSKGPSYLAIAAGAAAQSYFNRPTEQQKAAQALKIAQQYADLDYTRAMTAGARNAGKSVSMSGRADLQVTDPQKVGPSEPYSEFAVTELDNGYQLNVSSKVKPTLFGHKSPWSDRVVMLPWEEGELDNILGGTTNLAIVSAADGALSLDDLSHKKNVAHREMAKARKEYWADSFRFPPLAEPISSSRAGKMPAGALFDTYMDGLKKAGKWPVN